MSLPSRRQREKTMGRGRPPPPRPFRPSIHRQSNSAITSKLNLLGEKIMPPLPLTLRWYPHYISNAVQHVNGNWINLLQWQRSDDHTIKMIRRVGLYVIENPFGSPIYAGKALNLRSRFDSRTDALHNLGLDPAVVVPNHCVRIAILIPNSQFLSLAERWLVRILYREDLTNNDPRILQNIELTRPFNAPIRGLTIKNVGNRPEYLRATYRYNAMQLI
jgi:hypothetical protein